MSSLIHQGRASYAFFERNWNLTKRYWAWEIVWLVYNIVNALAVTFIGAAAQDLPGTKGLEIDTAPLILFLRIGTGVGDYHSVACERESDLITVERWECTSEHNVMAPSSLWPQT